LLQFTPLSMLRMIPAFVAARRVVPVEVAAIRMTKLKSLVPVFASFVKEVPPFVLLKMPTPRIASAFGAPSPVPAYITLALVGS